MAQKIQKQEIIDKIIKLRPFYYLSMRKGRFLYTPIKTSIFYFFVLLNQYSPIKIKIKAKTIWGGKISGYSSGSIGSIYYLGFQDPELTIFLIKSLKPGDIFIDAGSNIGYYSLLAKNLVDSMGKVYSFEPTPRTYSILKENVKLFSNIYPRQVALSDRVGVFDFIDYGPRFNVFNTFFKRKVNFLKNKGKVIKVRTETLDNFCIKEDIVPTIIKLDVEGSESLLLKGTSMIISKYRPLLILEVGGGKEWRENCQKSIKILLDNGYQAFKITPEGKLIVHNIKEEYNYDNLIFIPERKIESVLQLFA